MRSVKTTHAYEPLGHTICFTGHRPSKLGGYDMDSELCQLLDAKLEEIVQDYSESTFITGMALGFDQLAGWAVARANKPLIAAIPFEEQPILWPNSSQEAYYALLDRCRVVVNVSQSRAYHKDFMRDRNHWMVDRSDLVIACWDGSKGGTHECVRYALQKNIPVRNIYNEVVGWNLDL